MDALSRDDEVRAALALAGLPGVGPDRYRWLLERFGSAASAVEEGREAARRGELPPAFRRLADARPAPDSRLREVRRKGIRIVLQGEEGYPDRLLHLHHPPPLLYLAGPGALPARGGVGVVGTRRATAYGRRMARDLARGLAVRGRPVVSGMAAGVDGTAHRAALDADGTTVGVIGSGLDHRYPASNRDLYREMWRRGLLVSEFPPEMPPAPGLFPRRNRIIAALSEAVVVVQAGERSGALITASRALELGREVCAVPGPVGPPASVGVHDLLRDGAAPVTSAGDVLATLGMDGAGTGEGGEDGGAAVPSRDRLAAVLGGDAEAAAGLCRALLEGPRGTDDLALETDMAVARAAGLLARMELEGWVRSLPGGRFALPAAPAEGTT